VKKIA